MPFQVSLLYLEHPHLDKDNVANITLCAHSQHFLKCVLTKGLKTVACIINIYDCK